MIWPQLVDSVLEPMDKVDLNNSNLKERTERGIIYPINTAYSEIKK
jgi:hypothetical protein